MERERWNRVKFVADGALDLPENAREAFVGEACAQDAELRADVERLLRACARSEDFLSSPADEFADPMLRALAGQLGMLAAEVPSDLALALADRYGIERQVGRGGMAVVYLAKDRKHGSSVAIKVLRPEYSASSGPDRFLREIRIMAGLVHPHILPLLDSGSANGLLYYVTPFVEGESLRSRIVRRGRLDIDEAVAIAQEVAGALDCAHRRGIVHRDIKPENILMSEGQAVVADFGIARYFAEVDADPNTTSGLAIGSPAYMSPEQASAAPALDGRSDIYSLACVLYEMLVGVPPFTGLLASNVAYQHLHADPPVVRLARMVPLGIDAAIARALAKDPADRFPTAAMFALALESGGEEVPGELTPTRVVSAAAHVTQEAESADENCARASQCIGIFTHASYAKGARLLERALEIDPLHSQACVTLGSLYVLLSQTTQEGNPRARGVAFLQRAALIDPQLPEIALWTAWASMLDERYEQAEMHAQRGVDLAPNSPFGYHILGWVRMVRGLRTGEWNKCMSGAEAFRRCLAIHPRDFHALLPLGDLYALAGQYRQARTLFERALDVERSPANETRVIGALTFLGLTALHESRFRDAQMQLDLAFSEYRNAEQFFVPYLRALTLCGLGDLDRCNGEYGSAAVRYLRARALLDPTPHLMGCGYLAVRLETRLASTYSRLRMNSEAMRHEHAARSLSTDRVGYSFNWDWGVCEARLHYDWAVLHAVSANRQGVLDELAQATRYGWRETQLLHHEPAFAVYREDPALLTLIATAESAAPLPE